MVVETSTPQFPEALTLPQRARGLAIRDQETYTAAANFKLDLAAMRKRVVEEFAPLKEAAHKAHKAITTKENEYLAPITEAEGLIAGSLRTWNAEQERIRQAEQRRLEAEARAKAEEDRLRREAEAKAIRDEELRIAEELRKKDEALRIEAAAEAERNGGNVEAALDTPVIDVPQVAELEAYIAPPTPVSVAVAAPTFEPVKGLGLRTVWSAQVFSIKQLCAAVANGEVPETYISPNMTALNGRARSDKQMMKIPGVRAVTN